MKNNPLLFGIIGFLLGGLVVSLAATLDKPSASHDDMTKELTQKTGDEFDKAFIEGMIVHHQSALDMAELSAEQAKHQEVKDLSQEIIKAQQSEIDTMKQWQSAWGYSPSSSHIGH